MKRRVLAVALTLAVGSAACLTSEGPRFYPEWHLGERSYASIEGCATIDGWVAKSGKQGLGLVVHLVGKSPNGCSPAITGVELRMPKGAYPALRLPPPPMLREGQELFVYVPIAFDGNAAWNDEDQHHATIAITTAPAATAPIVWPVAFELRERFPCNDVPMPKPAKPPPPPTYAVPQ
jgi:hypothetical protein